MPILWVHEGVFPYKQSCPSPPRDPPAGFEDGAEARAVANGIAIVTEESLECGAVTPLLFFKAFQKPKRRYSAALQRKSEVTEPIICHWRRRPAPFAFHNRSKGLCTPAAPRWSTWV